MIGVVREAVQAARGWFAFVRLVPALVLLRLSTVSGVSVRAWRNVLVSVAVGVVASVVALVLLRRSSGPDVAEVAA